MPTGKRILVAALNWGLGHASRCVPLIKILQDLGHQVIIGSDGEALNLLRANFPELPYMELPELKINYSSEKGAMINIVAQLPKLNAYIRKERKALKKYLKSERIDLIISDNRYGIYHKKVPSVILTHQLKIKHSLAGSIASGMIKARLKYFKECWIPDDLQHSLSAELSSAPLSIPKVAIGSLSQFSSFSNGTQNSLNEEILVILSGPEPSRSQLEQKLVRQAEEMHIHMLIVKGRSIEGTDHDNLEFVRFEDQLSADQLYKLILEHKRIICRSGFSSIMDMSCLKKRALMIPTAGQPEQVYLATYHRDRQNFYSVDEKDLNLKRDLDIAYNGEFKPRKTCMEYQKQKELISERLEKVSQLEPA